MSNSNEPKPAGPSDQFRIFAGAAVGLVGLFGACVVFKAAVDQLAVATITATGATQIVTLASAVMTLIGTIVGAFVGVQAGSQGLASSEAARAGVEKIAQTLAQSVSAQPAASSAGTPKQT